MLPRAAAPRRVSSRVVPPRLPLSPPFPERRRRRGPALPRGLAGIGLCPGPAGPAPGREGPAAAGEGAAVGPGAAAAFPEERPPHG